MTGELLNRDCWVDQREDYGIEGSGMMCVMFVEQESEVFFESTCRIDKS
jgi:hypothetical protein